MSETPSSSNQGRRSSDMLSLSGINYHCYRAGQSFGIWHSLNDAAVNVKACNLRHGPQLITLTNDLLEALPVGSPLAARVRTLLPGVSRDLEDMGKQFALKGIEHRDAAGITIAELQRQGIGLPWWKSRWLLAAAGGLLALVVSTAISTALVFYLLK
jgi:hypothetical protein